LIIPLHAANPGPLTGAGNWTYLLTGATPALIDAGVGKTEHLDAIAAHVRDGPTHVFVTHGHSDHASGVLALAARWPQIRFWKFLWPSFDARYAVQWHALSDDQIVTAGDEPLQVVYTPGHAPDHVAFWQSSSRALFSADLVVLGSTVVIPPSAGGNLKEYLQSLRRVLALEPARLLPAHGPAIDDPKTVINGYLKHRLDRERQILSAIQSGLRSVEAITDRIYADLAPPLIPMARESVLAHLQKLEQEGLAARKDDAWHPLY